MKLDGASVVLTGAAGGIGVPTARALAAAGARLLLVGRDGARLTALASELAPQGDGRTVGWVVADLGTAHGIEAVRAAACERQADVLVNNAGVASFGRLDGLDAAHVAEAITTNLIAPIQLTQALLPELRRRPRAAVLNVGSALGRLGLPGFSVYSAAKFGLRGFSEALRRELADTAIRVQYLGPRVTSTGFNSAEVESYNRATGASADRPEVVAAALVDLLRSGRRERFIGYPEALAVRVNGVVPGALDGAFGRHRRALPSL